MSHIGSTTDCVHPCLDRISSKRKLDKYGAGDNDFSGLAFVRMKKDEQDAINSTLGRNDKNTGGGGGDSNMGTRASDGRWVSIGSLHFFVRNMSGGNTIVIHANSEDLVESVHDQIRKMTGIPIIEQRLIYRGKQLQWERSLKDCSIQNDAGLQLVGRMRSSEFPRTWQVINDLVSAICRLCTGGESHWCSRFVKACVKEFLKMTPREDNDLSFGHLQIFMSANAPTALIMLFISTIRGNKECAEESIQLFLSPNFDFLPKAVQTQCLPIVLEFCKMLSTTFQDTTPLYISCRNTLGTLLETVEVAHGSKYFNYDKAAVVIVELFPFVSELARKVVMSLDSSIISFRTSSLLGDAHDFAAFLLPLRKAIEHHVGGERHLPICLDDIRIRPSYVVEIGSLHVIFLELLEKVDECLKKMEIMIGKSSGENDSHRLSLSQYLSVLKQLNSISKLYQGAEEKVLSIMSSRRVAFKALIKSAKWSDEHRWILEHNIPI